LNQIKIKIKYNLKQKIQKIKFKFENAEVAQTTELHSNWHVVLSVGAVG